MRAPNKTPALAQEWAVWSRTIIIETWGIEGIWLKKNVAQEMRIFVVFKQNACLYPRIQEITEKSCYYPTPTEPRRLLEITEKFCYYPPPPPLNRVGFWRSRKRLKKFNNLNLAALELVIDTVSNIAGWATVLWTFPLLHRTPDISPQLFHPHCVPLFTSVFMSPSSSSSSLWILSVQIWTHSAQPRWALGSDKSYSL